MKNQGRAKLTEECGEVLQVLGKMQQYPARDDHPDGKGSLKLRLTNEIADLIAASAFVIEKMKLDEAAIRQRAEAKLQIYLRWDKEK